MNAGFELTRKPLAPAGCIQGDRGPELAVIGTNAGDSAILDDGAGDAAWLQDLHSQVPGAVQKDAVQVGAPDLVTAPGSSLVLAEVDELRTAGPANPMSEVTRELARVNGGGDAQPLEKALHPWVQRLARPVAWECFLLEQQDPHPMSGAHDGSG